VVEKFEEAGFSVAVDWPYAGTIVPLEYYGVEPRVSSMMVEVNRKLYMNESTGEKREMFGLTKVKIRNCLLETVGMFARLLSPHRN
jgi:N-formylglutamate amidohydrolase